MTRSIDLLGVFFFAALAIAWEGTIRNSDVAWVEPPREAEKRVDPTLARAMSFGNEPALVDWLWLQAMLDPSIAHVRVGSRASIFYDLILITSVDPAFYEAYLHGGNLLAVVRDDDDGALELLRRGESFRKGGLAEYGEAFRERFWANEWAIPLALAYVELYEKEDLPAAAESFRAAAAVSGSPPYLASLSKRLATVEGQYDVGIRLALFLEKSSKDPRLSNGFQEKRKSLEAGFFLYQANRNMKELIAKRLLGKPPADSASTQALWLSACPGCLKDPEGYSLRFLPGGRIATESPRVRAFSMQY